MYNYFARTLLIVLSGLLITASVFAQTIVMQEDFESGSLPTGWTQIYSSVPPVDWLYQDGGFSYSSSSFDYDKTPPAAHSGSHNAVFQSNNSAESMLVTPSYDYSAGKVGKLEYWFAQGCFYNQALNVYYREGKNGLWNLLKSNNDVVFNWKKDSIIIPSVSDSVFLAFQGIWDGGCGVCLDDITLLSLAPKNVVFNITDDLGLPVLGAIVTFNGITKLADLNGIALFTQVYEGLGYKYEVRKNGYSSKSGTVDVQDNKTVPVIIQPSRIIYVATAPATTKYNGTTWDSAYVSLDAALLNAHSGDQIWVAEGVYHPSVQWNISSTRAYSFTLKKEVAIFGGFPGIPGQERDLATQNVDVHKTILSGDVDKNDITDADGLSTAIVGENSLFVIFNNTNNLDNTAILNGVYITGGSSTVGAYRRGAAIYNQISSPTLTNCRIVGNEALNGGVVFNNGSSPQFFNTQIRNNDGTGMQNISAPAVIENCQFDDNTGNGMFNNSSDMTVKSTTFDRNGGFGVLSQSSFMCFQSCSFSGNGTNGLNCVLGASVDLDSCQINDNQQYGLYADNSDVSVLASIFSSNKKVGVYAEDVFNTTFLSVQNCSFSYNGDGTENGGAIHANSLNKAILYNVSCRNNNGLQGGALFQDNVSISKLTNAEFWNNAATDGGAVYFKNCAPTIYHITAERNSASNSGGFLVLDAGTASVKNAILWNNTVSGNVDQITELNGGIIDLQTTTIEGGFAGGTNISTNDPLFIDAKYGVLRHKGHSPIIEAGTDLSILEDILHKPRPLPIGGAVDHGAYERGPGIDVIGGFPIDNQQVIGTFKTFKLVFTENIKKGNSGTISLYYNDDNSLVQVFNIVSEVTISGDTAIFIASTELAFGNFHIEISEDAFIGAVSGLGYYGTVSPLELNFEVHREQVYVNPLAGGAKNGWDWHNAVLDFQTALDIAVPGQEIWISAGTFTPSVEVGGSGTRFRSFILQNENSVIGGFSGIPGTEGQLNARNTKKYPTVFSGDQLGNDDGTPASLTDNSYHIVFNDKSQGDSLTQSFVLSGITFAGGNADGAAEHANGAAMYLSNGALQIDSCQFIGNACNGSIIFADLRYETDTIFLSHSNFTANDGGANVYANTNVVSIYDCRFANNSAIAIKGLNADITVDVFYVSINQSNNIMELDGGTLAASNLLIYDNTGLAAFDLKNTTAEISHLTATKNTFSGYTVNYLSSNISVQNSILWDNGFSEINRAMPLGFVDYNIISGGDSRGGMNFDTDPLFYNPANNIFTLTQCSPAIDMGISTTVTHDISGKPRELGFRPDKGAYERKDGPCLVSSVPTDEYFGGRFDVFTLKFSENIAKRSGNIYIYTLGDDELVETIDITSATVSGTVLKFPVSSTVSFDEFYLLVDSAAIVSSLDAERVFDGIFNDEVINFTFHNTVKFVDIDATGATTGFSWTDAYTNLQDGIDAAIAGDFIWVAEGTYLPSTLRDGADPRSATFNLKDNVQVFGGFSATDDIFANRDPEAFPTILSGDLDANDTETADSYAINGNNSYHIVYSEDAGLTSKTNLNGLIFKGGDALGVDVKDESGGAIMLIHDSLQISQCVFKGNNAENSGGAIYSSDYIAIQNSLFVANTSDMGGAIDSERELHVTGSNFKNNVATLSGGAIRASGLLNSTISGIQFSGNTSGRGAVLYTDNSNLVIFNILAWGNTATDQAMCVFSNGFADIINVTIAGNSGSVSTGILGRFGSTISLYNSILWNDPISGKQQNVVLEGGATLTAFFNLIGDDATDDGTVYPGILNIDLNPRFVDPLAENFSLQRCSPAVDAGNNTNIIPYASNDYNGKPRIFDGDGDGTALVDLGAIETQGNCKTSTCPVGYDACWTACMSNNWFDAGNWNTSSIPTASTSVFIPGTSVVCIQPVIIGTVAECKTISIDTDNNAHLTIDADNGGKLQLGL